MSPHPSRQSLPNPLSPDGAPPGQGLGPGALTPHLHTRCCPSLPHTATHVVYPQPYFTPRFIPRPQALRTPSHPLPTPALVSLWAGWCHSPGCAPTSGSGLAGGHCHCRAEDTPGARQTRGHFSLYTQQFNGVPGATKHTEMKQTLSLGGGELPVLERGQEVGRSTQTPWGGTCKSWGSLKTGRLHGGGGL